MWIHVHVVNSRSRSLYASARPSVVCLSVICNGLAPYSGSCSFRQYLYGIWYLSHRLTFTENFTEIVSGQLKVVLITNRKLHMGFGLVQKSLTLNDLERRNGPYFALFQRDRVCCRRKTIIRPIARFQNLVLIVTDHINTICAIIYQLFGQNNRRQ